ncbi:MAG: hypothetical protein CMP85_02230 [Gammaproteobacteria bacterium]|nr:hypothetical protein [Gammaproteobacteria bacterium]
MGDLDFLDMSFLAPAPFLAHATPPCTPAFDLEFMDELWDPECEHKDGNPVLACFCGTDTCTKPYTRKPRHARVLEQSSQLVRYYDGGILYKNAQILLPAEIQAHIGHGSCCHTFDAFKLFLKYVQLELGWRPKKEGYSCALPDEAEYLRARDIMMRLGLSVDFYVHVWVPTFHARFVHACGGLRLLQTVTTRFLTAEKLDLMYGGQIICDKHDL